jgi:hypothetical protein
MGHSRGASRDSLAHHRLAIGVESRQGFERAKRFGTEDVPIVVVQVAADL